MTNIYEQLFRNALYPLYETALMKRDTFKFHNEYVRNQWLSEDELISIQWNKLTKLLGFCSKNVPYYQKLWEEEDIFLGDIKSMDDYQSLPILTKDNIKNNYEDLIAAPYIGKTLSKSTGGSTGVPLKLEFTRESDQRRTAVMWRGYSWAGADVGKKTAYVWGGAVGNPSPLKLQKERLFNALFRRYFLNSFNLTQSNTHQYIDAINRFKPNVIVGYVNPLYILAKYINENNVSLCAVESVITGAEALLPFQRDEIARAFNCPVFNTYGCREFMLIASECENHDGLHINIDHLVVETINDEGRQVESIGDLAITDLHNYGMPFIRYVNGDLGIISKRKCTCGRGFPLLESVEGRKLDVIRTKDGKQLPGEFFPHMMKDVIGIARFQVVQDSIDRIIVKIVKNEKFDNTASEYITQEIEKVLGKSVEIDYQYVANIPLTKTGKQRVTISNLPS